MTFALTTTHLRFTCEVTTPLRLEVENFRAGSNLRGALAQVMTRAYCAHAPTPGPSPVRTGEGCPVCWLLAAKEHPGQERRGYALVPPVPGRDDPPDRLYTAGERFEFGITLFGSALQFLPYFVLAVPEMGRMGIGPGRGKFALKSVWAVNPFSRARECLLSEGDNLVHSPTLTLDHAQVQAEAERLDLTGFRNLSGLEIRFVTPMRLIEEGKLAQAPALEALFARLLKRLDELAEQFSGGARRALAEVQALHALAARVRLVEAQTRWVEVWSGSNRRGAPSPLSGLVGHAVYAAPRDVWQPLLPWLLWGQLAQVGKNTVKGNGVIEIVN